MKKPNLILIIFILTISFFGCKEDKKEIETEKKPPHGQAHFIFFVPQKIKRACLFPPLQSEK